MSVFGSRWRLGLTAVAVAVAGQLQAADVAKPELPKLELQGTPIKDVKVAPGFEATLYAAPPDVSYCVALCTNPATNEVFVAVDQNGSLDRKPDRGWIVRCIDTDGDGKADKFNKFVEKVESPRGLIYDNGSLYVLHPPTLSKFTDTDGDGKADKTEVLVKGIGFGLDFRGADHTTNGIQMGIDGWIYVAVGDYGFIKATDANGKDVQMLGGGIVRVRPDGKELEFVSHGQRNIYDVAIDPLMNLFTRDNTNDGGGWEVRISHVPQGANMGYPQLFKNFNDEIIQPLDIYGGGSPCGALFVDEPALPKPWNEMLYTVEWGTSNIMAHPRAANGATFKVGQTSFVKVPRPTDMDIDFAGRMFIATWINGQFTFNPKAEVGNVIRVQAQGTKAVPPVDFKKMSDADLLKEVASPSHLHRLYAQLEILRRPAKPETIKALETLASENTSLPVQVAAIFTLKQLIGKDSTPFLVKLSENEKIREHALKALADRTSQNADVPVKPFVDALKSTDARVRAVAATGLGRLGKLEGAAPLIPLVSDADPVVQHLAIKALTDLRASDAAFAALDEASPQYAAGALRVLRGLHEDKVVDGLLSRFAKAQDPQIKRLIFTALARLNTKEGPYEGKWWGTRPDTSGPYYKTETWSASERILPALKKALADAAGNADLQRYIVVELYKHKVELPEAFPLLVKLGESDAAFRADAVRIITSASKASDEAIPLLTQATTDKNISAQLRGAAVNSLLRNDTPKALEGATNALANPGKELAKAREDFLNDARNGKNHAFYTKLAESDDAAKRELGYATLLKVTQNKNMNNDFKKAAQKTIDDGLASARAANVINAIRETKSDGYNEKIRAAFQAANASAETKAAAEAAAKQFKIDLKASAATAAANAKPAAKTIKDLTYEEVVATAMKTKGDVKRGEELFTKLTCVACHTRSADEQPKGPFLGDIAGRYNRGELAEAILKPSAKIAQGFVTYSFTMKDKRKFVGFVVREGGDEVEIRQANGEPQVLKTAELERRKQLDESVMPEGIADTVTPEDLGSLLSYLGTLTGHAGNKDK